eukprot:gb/GECH01011958.1/.p1 GENE.gb/GECH01011958.1/~~gb/GECH01011958.1/.p1  ORF type:complete len:304 (+),score=54.54 gb/GECH01011958.1/:1-912(+)
MPVFRTFSPNEALHYKLNGYNRFPHDHALNSSLMPCFIYAYARASQLSTMEQDDNKIELFSGAHFSHVANQLKPATDIPQEDPSSSSSLLSVVQSSTTSNRSLSRLQDSQDSPASSLSLQSVRYLVTLLQEKRNDGLTLCQEAMMGAVNSVMNDQDTFYKLYNTVSEGIENSALLREHNRRATRSNSVVIEEEDVGNPNTLWTMIKTIFNCIRDLLASLFGSEYKPQRNDPIVLNSHSLKILSMVFSASMMSILRIHELMEKENPILAERFASSMVDLLFDHFQEWDTVIRYEVIRGFFRRLD